jgi:beta-1,4-mannosyltransferase
MTQLAERFSAPPQSAGRHRQGHETLSHRVATTVFIIAAVAGLYAIELTLWPRDTRSYNFLQTAWSWSSAIWVVAFIPAVFEVIGLYLWRAPAASPTAIRNQVCWRIVSRGINVEALYKTVIACRQEMARTPLFPYTIEVVLDTVPPGDDLPPPGGDLRYIVVPADYTTPNGSLAKARALNYALWHSSLPATAWIVHMDEESHPTASSITGIAAAICEEETSGQLRVGQGTITYHRAWEAHPFFTLADCIRTGSDKGRLYLSMKLGIPFFGLHGSFIVLRNDVEKWAGFDLGPKGSLTEDAWWGVLASARGIRCRWVEGHVEEQCTHQASDFIKQRRRWFNGLARTALEAPAPFRWRAVLLMSMFAWASAPFAWAYTIFHIINGGYISPWVRALANFALAVYIATTLIGLLFNMKDHGISKYSQKIRWTLTWIVCMPVFSILEAIAVGFAILCPAETFQVVRK